MAQVILRRESESERKLAGIFECSQCFAQFEAEKSDLLNIHTMKLGSRGVYTLRCPVCETGVGEKTVREYHTWERGRVTSTIWKGAVPK